ncbi:hypothetical protein PPERSA_00617 [Pseudocohnilembus persalinus]|uniref:Uncharacterized protein n=1 Tax=Pseudocohnilembus persalinus TaxID=266149 RepID=A0A0V0QSV1_PSEPJ|nr:hypothetical protein PPERSA_00617 [Pseudocohnilembus persalinus]|eukprot:KRX05316.1 hypothetical protein PPERSA_00617 [Pseudocohnilembus persalinus]
MQLKWQLYKKQNLKKLMNLLKCLKLNKIGIFIIRYENKIESNNNKRRISQIRNIVGLQPINQLNRHVQAILKEINMQYYFFDESCLYLNAIQFLYYNQLNQL